MFRIIPEGLTYKERVLLKNGQGLIFRPAVLTDIPKVESFMTRVSRESLRMRFMASISQVSSDVIKQLCSGDFKTSGCLVALTGDNKDSQIVGLGNYIAAGNGHTAEVAFLIEDDFQGKGIGTLLLERLAGLAAANGFIEFEAEVLPDNQPMINVFKSSGFERYQVWSSDTVHIELPVGSAGALWEITGLRERISVANSLIPLLRPKVVAVIGASRDTSSIGNIIFKNILSAHFTGTIYPINPHTNSVNGIKTYAYIKDVPEKVDLAVIAVNAEKVYDVARESIQAGAMGLVVVSAGFADAGEAGLERQRKLAELVRAHGVRLLGPSCLGVMNTDPKVRLNASMAPEIMPPGHTGFFSHSAALGLVILDYALEKGVSFTTFVSAGNRADVSGNDLLQYWEEDPNTKMAILYLETFGNPRRFVRIARRMTNKKPILCIKSGKSIAGRRTTELKSGAIRAGEREVEALFQ
ncbi:MAG TPA: GNAT family N-acetyltransferase, partial [Ignavibacteriaceae bacterium]|nr:GNAT family N-acetyltransferase [Ignavibacteriaceae bacterium]